MTHKHIGLIGLGSIAKKHLHIIKQINPNITTTVLRRSSSKQTTPIKNVDYIVYSMEDFLKQPLDGAIICTPACNHIQEANCLLANNIPVMVEKPLATDYSEALNLSQLDTVLVAYVLRYHPAFLKFKMCLEQLNLGKLLAIDIEAGSYLPEWRPDQDYKSSVSANKALGGGVLLELSHELDYMLACFGEVSVTYAELRNSQTLDIQVEDQVFLNFSKQDKTPIRMNLDFCRRKAKRCCVIYAQHGTLSLDFLSSTVCWEEAGKEPVIYTCSTSPLDMYTNQMLHFIDYIDKKASPVVNAADALKVLKLIKNIHKKSSQHNLCLN